MMQNRENVNEDRHQCKFCTDLCYFSMIKCTEHTVSTQNSQQSSNTSAETMNNSKYTNKVAKRAAALEAANESGQYCIHHLAYCGCPIEHYSVVYRYSTQELHNFMDIINKACIDRDSSIEVMDSSQQST